MDRPRDYHTKWRKKEKNKYNITYMWNLKYDTNAAIFKIKFFHEKNKIWTYLQNRRVTVIENRPVLAKEEEGGGGMDWEFGIMQTK